jgi:hypothetical protein
MSTEKYTVSEPQAVASGCYKQLTQDQTAYEGCE